MKITLPSRAIKAFLVGCCLVVFLGAQAQSGIQELLSSKDLSTFKVDNLTDDDIAKYRVYLQNAGMSESQLEQIAIQKGLPSSEVLKLKARLAGSSSVINKNQGAKKVTRIVDSLALSKPNDDKNKVQSEIFGAELFNNPKINLAGNVDAIATPQNYILGPGDELAIDVFGYQETNPRLTVSPEGTINIPNVGIVPVNGLTVEQATKRIKDKMARNGYAGILNGQTKVIVSIGKIRTIKVTVIGEAKSPGTFTVSSLSNLFNVLYLSGGPNDRGSLRTIELVRNNKVITKLDVYDFLLKGMQTANVRLEEQDVVRIPVAKNLVRVRGEVKREGIYEVLPNENLSKLIEFAGGFTSKAYTANISVIQYTDREKQIKDIAKEQYNNYQPNNGDEISVRKVLDRFSNRVIITGSVYREGNYELTPGLTLAQLIKKADGLTEDAFLERGLIFRLNEDSFTNQIIHFHVGNIALGRASDIVLKKNDSIYIGSTKEFKESYTITVDGEVKKPGVYDYYKGVTLKDILFQTGGFTDAASTRHIEVARRVKSDSATTTTIAQVLDIQTEADLSIVGNDIALQPWDVIMVRTNPGYKAQVTVKLEGEVLLPGVYVIANKTDKVSDIIKRAGGLTPQADRNGASITRINTSQLKENTLEKIQKLKKAQDSSNQFIEDLSKPTVKIGLQLTDILANPGSIEDVTLLEGDIITVPKGRNVVKVNGEVMFPTEVVYKEGASMDYYIDKAGGYTENAKKTKLYVLNSNGSAAKTKKFLFFRSYPKVLAGGEILVPGKADKTGKGLSTGELIALGSGLASIAGVVIAIINVSKK
jgi:protein involved in polysaccharide export with SLBB domain